MDGRPGSANDDDDDDDDDDEDEDGNACGNACGNANNVRASNRRGSVPSLNLDALVIVVVNVDADEGPPFISGPDPAGPFRLPKTQGVPYPPPGLRFANCIFPCTCKRSTKIRRKKSCGCRRGNK